MKYVASYTLNFRQGFLSKHMMLGTDKNAASTRMFSASPTAIQVHRIKYTSANWNIQNII